MDRNELSNLATGILQEIFDEKGLALPGIHEDTQLLGAFLGLDSLDLAALVVRLCETTGKDPFQKGFIPFRTFGELIQIFLK
jgi:acyl carrier protein